MTQSTEVPATASPRQDSSETLVCWSCAAPLRKADLFCGKCSRIQPLSSEISFFEVFALPRKLQLDTSTLEREFYRLSRRLHPDVFARASPQEQEWSLANSSLLNDAYRTLKDPIKRTEYLLKLEGIVSPDEGGAKVRIPADLLEEVFELNMQLDEMRMNRQMGEDDPQLEKDLLAAKTNFDQQLKATDTSLASLWEEWDAGVDHGEKAERATTKEKLAALLDRRRYIRNLVNSVNEALGV